MKRILPSKITDATMEHIHEYPRRRHITQKEIQEALQDRQETRRNKREGTADLIIEGKPDDGPKLAIYVTLIDEGRYKSEVVTARLAD